MVEAVAGASSCASYRPGMSDRIRRLRRAVGGAVRDILQVPRVLLAAKAALAAGLAWGLAPLLPFVSAEYAYYAPLGALISMYPTVARSARSGAEAVLGLGLGIVVGIAGFALLLAGVPGVAAVAAVAAAGVLASGIRVLGAGREWVPIAALFVLVFGGADLEEYSLGYLVHVAFGVLVGLAVNALILPPLYLRRAGRRLSTLRDRLADLLREVAAMVDEGGAPSADLDRRLDELGATLAAVRDDVREAGESRRGNLRGRRRRAAADENDDRMRALDRTAFFVRDLVDLLAAAPERWSAGDGQRELAAAIRSSAELVATPIAAAEGPARLENAEASISAFSAAIDERADGPASAVADDLALSVTLRRIVDAARPFVV